MKLYHFPSPNPQKVRFALNELQLACDIVPVDLTKGEHRRPEFLALNPCGRVPVLVDGDLTLWESHAILSYLGEKTGRLWPASVVGRGDALRWLFFLTAMLTPPIGAIVYNRIAVKAIGATGDEAAVARGEQQLVEPLTILDAHLATRQWLLGKELTLVDCAYTPMLNAVEKAGVALEAHRRVKAYLDAARGRQAWQETPRAPGL